MTPPRSRSSDRRTVLTGLAASLGSLALAGCVDALDGGGEETTDDSDSSDDDSGADPDATDDASEENSSDDASGEDPDATDDASGEIHAEYESIDVSVVTPDGDELGEVTAAIADTLERQRLGLSDTDELPEDRGMLFVYESVQERRFAMPDMSFGIDIIFADDEGVITSIHHAPEPGPDEDGSEQTYTGRGQYVLEVGYEWTAERGVEEGDVLVIDG